MNHSMQQLIKLLTWVSLILSCVSLVTYRVRINGCLTDTFWVELGLQQGDPLSLFLFHLCSQGLSSLLAAEQRDVQLRGLRTCPLGPRITHLLHADDSHLFFRHSNAKFCCVREVLRLYATASGQVANPGRYLGTPLLIGRNKLAAFGFLHDRVLSRVQGWSKQLLFFDGKDVLSKLSAKPYPLTS
ncbi:hypothetical protein F3Y22_tig00110761pilonHSYRG00050 [Hibiscus syriacus]|uniref:Uncharacterized protein n=1 Tax=Hibiscus syriacus TaxID=106335 RepID=A0A6A2ZUK1_HIBSY|nr:hypothetical protein F3Y22_tig00110761pilonHSYRG00050 [Hibiscus syriacus]